MNFVAAFTDEIRPVVGAKYVHVYARPNGDAVVFVNDIDGTDIVTITNETIIPRLVWQRGPRIAAAYFALVYK